MPTLGPLLRAAYFSARKRTELLLLLAVFAGLLASIFYTPALTAIVELVTAASETTTDDKSITSLGEQAVAYLPTLLLGQLTLFVISGFLLPFWARASSPAGLIPLEKNSDGFLRRGALGFLHLLTAALLTLISLVIIIMLASLLGFAGASGGFGIMIALGFGIWLSVYFSAAAHTAIIAAATDQKMTFSQAIIKNRPVLRPIVGTLAIIWFGSIAADAMFESILTTAFGGLPPFTILAFMKGAFGLLVSALHISVLMQLLNFTTAEQP